MYGAWRIDQLPADAHAMVRNDGQHALLQLTNGNGRATVIYCYHASLFNILGLKTFINRTGLCNCWTVSFVFSVLWSDNVAKNIDPCDIILIIYALINKRMIDS